MVIVYQPQIFDNLADDNLIRFFFSFSWEWELETTQPGSGFISCSLGSFTFLKLVLSEVTYVAVVNSWVCWVKGGLSHVWCWWWLSAGPPFPCSFPSWRRTTCISSHDNSIPKWWEWKMPSSVVTRFGSCTSSFQPHSVGPNKSQGQPRFRGWRNSPFLLGRVANN